MSTFSGLNTAYRGLTAARAGLDVVGQNISNASTDGYTRQRVTTSSINAVQPGLFSQGTAIGQGVSIDGYQRIGDAQLDQSVRATASTFGLRERPLGRAVEPRDVAERARNLGAVVSAAGSVVGVGRRVELAGHRGSCVHPARPGAVGRRHHHDRLPVGVGPVVVGALHRRLAGDGAQQRREADRLAERADPAGTRDRQQRQRADRQPATRSPRTSRRSPAARSTRTPTARSTC